MTHQKARALMRLVPSRGPATLTLDADSRAVPQIGTISGSGSTITGVGTFFKTGPVPLVSGSVIVANSTGGTLNYVASGFNSVTAGTALTVVSVASDTSLTVLQTGLSFAGAVFYADRTSTVNVYNAWQKPISGKLKEYGHLNVQGDETLLHIPDHELNPASNGRQIRSRDIIVFGGQTFVVQAAGTTLKSVLTDWVCVCGQKVS